MGEKLKEIVVVGEECVYRLGEMMKESVSLVYMVWDDVKKINVMVLKKRGRGVKELLRSG